MRAQRLSGILYSAPGGIVGGFPTHEDGNVAGADPLVVVWISLVVVGGAAFVDSAD
jgi:hypothetical protein